MQTAVVTGTTSGIGLATSLQLARRGYQVYAGMRNLQKADALMEQAATENLSITPVEIDVCDVESVQTAFEEIQASNPIDVLINNAGIAGAAPLEFTTEEDHKRIFETNYFGVVRCIKAVVKGMRERQQGAIVNISSAAGLMACPNQVAYSASKWAVECLGEALAHELVRFNIKVINIEPNVVMTEIFKNASKNTYFDPESPYIDLMKKSSKMFSAGMRKPATIDDVTNSILKSIESNDQQLRWPVGDSAKRIYEARQRNISDQWISLGREMSDQIYMQEFSEIFGIDLAE